MKTDFIKKAGIKLGMTAFLICSASSSFTQAERIHTHSEPVSFLKYRGEIPTEERISPGESRTDSYLILHFNEHLPDKDRLEESGIRSLNYINSHTIYAHVPQDLNLSSLENFAWSMELRGEDKIQQSIPILYDRFETVPVLIYLPNIISEAERNDFILSYNINPKPASSLPHYVIMAEVELNQLNEIANDNYVSWISKAPVAALRGTSFHFCAGIMTPYGPQAEFSIPAKYNLQGSDWDGPGLGCADLTYHFENGTPDLSGTTEWTIVANALDEWVTYAGLTFTETATQGLDNSLDIRWGADVGDPPFDGPSGTLAYAYFPQYGGDINFDEGETWTSGGGGGIDLFAVAVHEIGHSLGLNHSDNASAVMAAYYSGAITGLHSDDIAGIQAIYSSTPCDGGGGTLYCSSSGSNSSYEWINSITVAGTTNNSGNNSGYGNFTTSTPISLTSGGSASVSLSPGFSGSTYNEYWRIWIDYNKNNTFDASELVYSGSGSSTVTGSFSVPSGLTGETRMRISMKYGGNPDPCETFTYGEVEDYTVSFDAPAAPTYCTSAGNNASYEWIERVTLSGYYYNSGNDGGYGDHTAATFNLNTGSNTVTLTPGFSGSTYNEYWRIWIDYNLDGTFAASELAYSGSGSAALSGSFSVPAAHAGVTTRMRVSMKYGGNPDPCETFTYGEVEDYTVTISPAPITATLNNDSQTQLTIYPNPVSDNPINITGLETGTIYQIIDISGRIVMEGIYDSTPINIAVLEPGNYLVRLNLKNKIETLRFIKK